MFIQISDRITGVARFLRRVAEPRARTLAHAVTLIKGTSALRSFSLLTACFVA